MGLPLLPLPPRSTSVVLEQHTASGQLAPDPVGGGEVALTARAVTVLDQALDLPDRHWRLLVLGAPQADHPEHLAEFSAPTSVCIAPSAAAVFRSSIIAAANAFRPSSTRMSIEGCVPGCVTRSTRARKSVKRRSAS